MQIKNYFPDSDKIVIIVSGVEITIWRDEISDTFVEVLDIDGTEYSLILGSDSETTKL